jgi:hypothetical protein
VVLLAVVVVRLLSGPTAIRVMVVLVVLVLLLRLLVRL